MPPMSRDLVRLRAIGGLRPSQSGAAAGAIESHSQARRHCQHWARYQFCRIYFKICRRGAPAKIVKKFAVGPDFHICGVSCGVLGLGLRVPLGLKGWALGRLRLKRLKTGLGPF